MNLGAPCGVCSGYVCKTMLEANEEAYLQENMGEARPEVCAIDVELLLAGNVHVLAAGTVHLHTTRGKLFTNADGEHILAFAHYAGASPEAAQHEFLFHHGETTWRQNEARVN